MSELRTRRTPLRWAGVGAWALIRLVLLLGCFALAYYAVDLLLLDSPSVFAVAIWFAGALFLHDLVLFPLYAGGDRILSLVLRVLPDTRVPLINHVRIPVLGAGLALIMFLPGIIRQGGETTLTATGLDQEPYRERWVYLAIGLFAVSALIWLVRWFVEVISPGPEPTPHDSPGHDQQAVRGDRQDGLGGEPASDLPPREHPAREDEPHPER